MTLSGLKIAVVKEGFGHPELGDGRRRAGPQGRRDVPAARGACRRRYPSRCIWPARAIWTPIAVEGATWQMMNGNGFGFNWKGLYVTSLVDAHSALAVSGQTSSPDTLKTTILFGQYALNKYRGHYYAKSPESRAHLRAAYDAGAEGLRPAPDADASRCKATPIPKPGRAAHGDHPAGVRDAAEHRAHQCDRTSLDERALRVSAMGFRPG